MNINDEKMTNLAYIQPLLILEIENEFTCELSCFVLKRLWKKRNHSMLDETAIIFDEDKHEMPALHHSKEKKYEEEFDVYDNEDPKREERIIDYYYETAEYIEKSNELLRKGTHINMILTETDEY
ncbi:hypothetical protein T12_2422 [Trichinella patagoniensis]|uniref:Uncharacterized protein n=1 Tax=Trichinella patagoniensis TaxID=990121 RepID=A0A0V0ZBM2_9BILA|nr:hypothetical protein T12_2422 [Trichinella patagoniensis]